MADFWGNFWKKVAAFHPTITVMMMPPEEYYLVAVVGLACLSDPESSTGGRVFLPGVQPARRVEG